MNQEPIAWMSPDGKVSQTEGKLFHIPLYTTPQTKKCEPICRPSACDCIKPKPLSDEEILEYSDVFSLDNSPLYEFTDKGLILFTRSILQRHGIK
jgi:hypothetical protein